MYIYCLPLTWSHWGMHTSYGCIISDCHSEYIIVKYITDTSHEHQGVLNHRRLSVGKVVYLGIIQISFKIFQLPNILMSSIVYICITWKNRPKVPWNCKLFVTLKYAKLSSLLILIIWNQTQQFLGLASSSVSDAVTTAWLWYTTWRFLDVSGPVRLG